MATIAYKGNPSGPITQNDVITKGPLRPYELTPEGALRLNVQDAARFEAWLGEKQWALQWRESDILFQSPRTITAWEGTGATRANVNRFTVAKHTNTLVPMMMSGIFYDAPPFVLRPRPNTLQSTVRAKTALFGALLDDIDFKYECEQFLESQCLNGTGIAKRGWITEKRIEKKFLRKKSPTKVTIPFGGEKEVHTKESDEFQVREMEVTTNRPFFENCPLGTVLVDPGWKHANKIHKAKAVIHRNYYGFEKFNELREQTGYTIPSEEQLKALFFPPAEVAPPTSQVERNLTENAAVHHAEGRDQITTADPLEHPFKFDERWDKHRVITVVNDKLLIRNELHGLGKIPFYSANWWNIQNAGYGLGIGRLTGSDQRVEQGSMNAALDILSMAVNQQYVRSRGANVPTQQIRSRLGGIIDVDGKVADAFKILETPTVPPEVWTAIQAAKQSSESLSGADEAFGQGTLPGKGGSSVGRTATGAGGIIAANAGRIQGPVGRFVDNVFIAFLRDMDEMIKERMPMSEIREILAEELGDDYEMDMDNFLNASMKYEVLAGAHLAAKKAMAQSLPFLIQIFENPHMVDSLNQMGWMVDVKELFDMLMEMSEWKNSREVVRKMKPDELKIYQQSQQAAPLAKVQGDLAKINAQHQAKSAEIDQTQEGKLAATLAEDSVARAHGYIDRQVVEHASQPRALGTADAQYHTAGQ